MGFSAFAESVIILDTRIGNRGFGNTDVDTRFFMNTNNGQGYADVEVSVTDYRRDPFPPRTYCDRWGRCYPRRPFPNPLPTTREIYDQRIQINNLKLVGDQMIYYGRNGRVNCGRLGESRVLRVPTLYLSGNCQLRGSIRGGRLTVRFTAN